MARSPAKPKEETAPTPAAQDTLPGQDTAAGTEDSPPVLGDKLVGVPMVIVVGPAKGRWRIGRKFTPEPTALVLADLSEAEIAALMADPELSVLEGMGTAAAPEA